MSNAANTADNAAVYRHRRNVSVGGMLAAFAVTNAAALLVRWREGVIHGDLSQISVLVSLVCGLLMIGFFVAACVFYAQLRGYKGFVGTAGALIGLLVWGGVALLVLVPDHNFAALAEHGLPNTSDDHAPFAPWVGAAVAGLLLKALPERSRPGQPTPSTTI